MPPRGEHGGPRHRSKTNRTSGTTLFKYGAGLKASGNSNDDVLVYYWSPGIVLNASEDVEDERLNGGDVTVATGQQQQRHQLQQLAESSIKNSSVHSAAVMLTIAAIFVTFTLTTVAALLVFWCKSNSVFALQKSEQRDIADEEADEEDGAGTESETDSAERLSGGSRTSSMGRRRRHQAAGQAQWMRLRNQEEEDDDDDERYGAEADAAVGAQQLEGHHLYHALPLTDSRPPSVCLGLPSAAATTRHNMMPLMRPLASAADAVVKATSSTFRPLCKSRSETSHMSSELPFNAVGQLSPSTPHNKPGSSRCRLTLSKSTANWTAALYEPS